MYLRNFAAVAGIAVLLSSCASPPKMSQFEKTRIYQSGKDAVWEKLLAFFTANSIQIKTIEKDSGVIYAERAMADATMADCGQPGLAIELARPGSLNVFVRGVGSGTEVNVNTQFTSLRQFDNQTFTTQCHSTGVLEKQILDSIGQ